MIAPTSVSSRFSARPMTPLPKSSISFNMASVRPSILATPSPISRTMPTFWRATEVFTPEIWASISCSILLINQFRSDPRLKAFPQRLEARPHAAVVNVAAHVDAQSADQRRILGEGDVQSRAVSPAETGLNVRLLAGGKGG